MNLENRKAGELEDRPTPETNALLSKFFAPCRPAGGTHGQAVGAELWSLRFTGFCRAEFEESVRAIERQRDEARAAEAEWKGVAEMMSADITRFFAQQFGRVAEPMLGGELLAKYRERAAAATAKESAS